MDCEKCDRESVMHAAYAGSHLCESHFIESVERRIRRRIRKDNLLGEASPEDPQTWLVGLSGGKDSAVLTTVLAETFGEDPRVELVALTVHEGIEGYRDESVDSCVELAEQLGVTHEVVSYAEEFGVEMDDVAADDPLDMAPCAYCGVFRRDVLARSAGAYDADKLLVGHNLDDEAETALMNVFEGDVAQMGDHYDASLGPFPGAGGERAPRAVPEEMVPRAKPLRDVPEKEVALYARLRDLPAHIAECPHASRSYRAEIQELMLSVEEGHPGTRHSVMAGYEELAELAAQRHREETEYGECVECGAPTAGETCRTCSLLAAVR
jgi:uncharacterized protein (TIGR00269 family)